ncbi:MAG: histidine kinase [Anaerolineae bacterium]|nr:histidine kinase [Anaerolineae bacterium]
MRKIRGLWYGGPLGTALAVILPALPAGLGVGHLSGQTVPALIISLAISGLTYLLFSLDLAFIHPLFRNLPPNRAVLMEITTGLIEFIAGTWLAFSLCNWLLGTPFEGVQARWLLAGTIASITIFHILTYTFLSHADFKRKLAEEERLRAMATEAELKALKAQINPHFLFNTLNTIAALIHTDPPQAEATVERLAGMFRYVLAGSERGAVPLREELAFVDDYLRIEQARFGEQLRVTRDIAPAALDVPVPGLILQPLVENAVQHGRRPDGSIDLALHVQRNRDTVSITIADQGPGMSPSWPAAQATGHGLRNVDERLLRTYGEAHRLVITANTPAGTRVTLTIPVRAES